MGYFEGKVALVTGGASGLGRATCQLFAREGAKVVVADIQKEMGEETVRLVKAAGGDATLAFIDLAKQEDCKRMVQVAVDTYGGLDCAANVAVLDVGNMPFAEITEEDWHRTLAVNFTRAFLSMKYELQAMLKRGGGAIINVGSGPEYTTTLNMGWYIGQKRGSYGLVKSAALDYATQNIRVNAVGPGVMWTPWNRDIPEENKEWMRNLSPMKRGAQPEEVAEAIIWLCSPASSFVTGQVLCVDGGATLA